MMIMNVLEKFDILMIYYLSSLISRVGYWTRLLFGLTVIQWDRMIIINWPITLLFLYNTL